MTGSRRRGPPREPRGLGGEQVEGRRAVRELLAARRRRVRGLTLAAGRDASPLLEEIGDLARDAHVRVRRVTPEQLSGIARTDAPQGVVAQADPVVAAEADRLLETSDAFVLALDGVTDPGNLGAMLRTAEAAGASGVLLPRHRAVHLTPAAVKAAAGAVEHVPIASVAGIPSVLDHARRRGVWTVGLDESGDVSLFDLEVLDRALVMVLGAEGRGLSRLTRARCDVLTRIPMRGALASLNVSAAAALACFEVARRRAR